MGLLKEASRDWRAESSKAKKAGFWLRSAVLVAAAGLLSIPCSLFSIPALAQSPTYGLGRTPSSEEIHVWDISISPTGKELPPGSGNAKEGAQLFVQKGCSVCHGAAGSGGPAPNLIKPAPLAPGTVPKPTQPGMDGHMVPDTGIMALRVPYATTIWDYIHRGMPLGKEGSLKPDEVYSLVAFLLFKNGVIQEAEVLDAQSLPKVKMPNRDGVAPLPEWKHGTPRLQGYP